MAPDEDAYGRVTNPDRYEVLHEAGQALLDRLVTDYRVRREESPGSALDEELAGRTAVERTVCLAPVGDGAPLTVAFSVFPGLLVRYGKWAVEAYPACGCDACDESPAALLEGLHNNVESLVAGGFTEGLHLGWRPSISSEFTHGHTRQTSRPRREVLALGPAPRWQPWTRR